MAQTVSDILKDNISDPSVFFVFPTQVAADSWADELLNSMGTGTVAMERFTAWDTFKGKSIRSQKQDKTSVPSLLRKLFAARLIAENAALVKNGSTPLFTSLISPSYAQEASCFTDWVSSLLPQLALWKKHLKAAPKDPEDVDLERLYETYRDFLEEKKLFDPAWETPPFDGRGNRYIIFYPEILEDFAEYQDLLNESPCITLVKADELAPLSQAGGAVIRSFSNSRAELHALALEILRAHEEDGVPYEDIAVSIDKDGLLLPYLTRELELYSIPVKKRLAQPLTSRGAGRLFPQIQECVSSNFSFEAVKDLLLNNDLPWKEKQYNMQLINFGIKNSCICSFEKNGALFDVWKDAFKAAPHEQLLERFYDKLNLRLTNISRAKSFKDIEESYFAFRNDFFDQTAFTEDADNILGRCIAELAELIRLQDDYDDMQIDGCFAFFTQQLAQTQYLAQSSETGVLLYPYRNAAAAPKMLHFVPAAGQDAVTVTYSPLRFLSQEKRAELGVEDTDVSALFLKMYAQNSTRGTWFSCAEKSFAGYTLPHSALPSEKATVPDTADSVAEQQAWLLDQTSAFPATVSETDKAGFAQWSALASSLSSPDTALAGIDESKLYKDGMLRISQSTLKDFFGCPRYWYYNRCLKLRPFSLEAGLMEDVWIGTLYHLILEHFFTTIRQEDMNQILDMERPDVLPDYSLRIEQAIDAAFKEISGSPLSKDLLLRQRDAYIEKVRNCLLAFCDKHKGCSVVAMEKDISMPAAGKDYFFTGKIDLVLRTNEGGIILVDYKTGKCPSKTDCFPDKDDENLLKDFQFAMYIKLWEWEHPEPENKVTECCFFKINDCIPSVIVGKTDRNPKYREDMDASIDLLEAYSDQYAAYIRKGTLDTDIKPAFTDCAKCDYRAICRSTYTVSGDASLLAAREEQNDE